MDAASTPERRFSASIALLTLARLVEDRLEPVLRARGLSLRKYAVLGHIAATPGASYSELARRSRITVQSTHTLIQSLVDADLVQSATPAPGMPARLSVSPAGARLLAEVARELERLDAELFRDPPLAALEPGLREAVRSMSVGPPTFS
jgi:DNA-binding MarR family transcriptional regulator